METSIVISDFVDARVTPKGSLENLSQAEVAKLLDSGRGGTYELFRKCALAVLNSGSEIDSAKDVSERYRDFDIRIEHQTWGIKLVLRNAPATAFVDGEMIQGIKEHLFAVLRDVIYIGSEIIDSGRFDLKDPASITNAVFHILRNARILDVRGKTNLIVCWGGHCDQPRGVRLHQEGRLRARPARVRRLDRVRSGSDERSDERRHDWPFKQRIQSGRYIGITEPGIIAAEPPNPIVSHLVIMPDIEKRLEAFARVAHGIVRVSGWSWHRGGDSLSARHPARSGQCHSALPGNLHRARRECWLLRADQSLYRHDPRR